MVAPVANGVSRPFGICSVSRAPGCAAWNGRRSIRCRVIWQHCRSRFGRAFGAVASRGALVRGALRAGDAEKS